MRIRTRKETAPSRKMPLLDSLIDENRSLRETIELLTYCREIASHLDAEPIASTALQIMTGASAALSGAALWLLPGDAEWKVLATTGLTKSQGRQVADRLRSWIVSLPNHLSEVRWVEGESFSFPPPAENALFIPIRVENRPATLLLLGFPAEVGMEGEGIEQLQLIANQTALALTNALRFESARQLTFVDDVTGAFNNRYLEAFLDRELKRAEREKYPVSFLFLDIDDFKSVNDTFGHLVGSRILLRVAQIVKNTIRSCDIVVRYGGDEYVVILVNTPTEGARLVADRIRRRIGDQSFDLSSPENDTSSARISVSIGIATYPVHAQDKRTLLRMADSAMYEVKGSTKNAVHVVDSAGERLSQSHLDPESRANRAET